MTTRYLALLLGLLLFNGAHVFAGTVKKKKEQVQVLDEPEAYAQNLRSQTARNAFLRQQNKVEEQNFIVGKDTLFISAAAKAEANQLLIDFASTYAIEYYVAFVFEVQDASGQITSPVPNPTTVTEYGKRIFSNSKLGGTRSLLLTIKIEDWIYSDTSVVRHFNTDFRMGQNTICENLRSAGDYTFVPFSEGYDVAFLSYVNNIIGMFEACIEAEGGMHTLAFVQEELIKEGLLYFKEEITFFLENKDKQGLDEEANARLASFPECLPKEDEALEGVLGKIEEHLVAPEDLLALVKEDETHKSWLEALSARLTGEDAPFSDKLEESEWSEWLGKMCKYLIEHIPVIEGVTRNPELVVIHSISEVIDPGKDRLMISYTLKDTLGLDYNTLEIYKLEEGDTTMVTFYSDLPKGVELDFIDNQDGNKIGWAGRGTDGEYVEDGLYRISIISAVDSLSTKGFIDYEQFEVKDINEPEFEITTDQLEDIFPDTDKERIKEVVEIINKYSNDYGLTTKTRMAHFLGQIGTETSGLEKLKESSNYSAKNIFNIFLKVKRKKEGSDDYTHKYCDLIEGYDCLDLSSCIDENNGPKHCSTEPDYDFPEKDGSPDYDKWIEDDNTVKTSYVNSSSLFDYVYSCRMDNGAKSTNDGSTYLGKGFIHMTGKDKYKKVSEAWNKKYPDDKKEFHGEDIDELENNVEIAMKASLVLWELDDMNDLADGGTDLSTIKSVTKAVNGGYNGLDHRKEYTEKAVEVFDKDEN